MADFADLVREDNTQKNLADIMKMMLHHSPMTEGQKQKIKTQIDDVTGERLITEHTKQAENFKFTSPAYDLESWKSKLRSESIEPRKEVHYRTEYGVSYANVKTASYTADADAEGYIQVAYLLQSYEDTEERRRQEYKETNPGQVYLKRPQPGQEVQDKEFNDAKAATIRKNLISRFRNPEWVILQRAQTNDTVYEDKELRFRDTEGKSRKDDNRETDWTQNIINIAQLGVKLGYTETHYKCVLSRFISWFSPELTLVTQNLSANETAAFLLKLNMPDTPKEKVRKQLENLSRKPNQQLRHVMAFLYEISKELYKDRPAAEKEHEIKQTMLTGLLRFIDKPLRAELAKAITWAKSRDQKLDWKSIMEKTIDREAVYGMPNTELRFRQPDTEVIRDYNVKYRMTGRPEYAPKYAPGQGGHSRDHNDEPEIEISDPMHYGSFPDSAELRKAMKVEELKKDQLRSITPDIQKKDTQSDLESDTYLTDDEKSPEQNTRRTSARETKGPDRYEAGLYATATTVSTPNTEQRQWRGRSQSKDRNNGQGNNRNTNRDRTPDRRRNGDRQSRQTKEEAEEEIRRKHRNNSLEAKKLAQAGARMEVKQQNNTKTDNTRQNSRTSRDRSNNDKPSPRTNYTSSDRNTYRDSSNERIERQRGKTYATDYDRLKMKECDKCRGTHHPFDCTKYRRHSLFVCKKCSKGLRHWDEDCVERTERPRSRTPDRNQTGTVPRTQDRYQQGAIPRTPDRYQQGATPRTPDRNQYETRQRTPDRNQYETRQRTPDRNQYETRARTPDRNQYGTRPRTPDRNQYETRARTPDRNQYGTRPRTPDRNQYGPRDKTPIGRPYSPRPNRTDNEGRPRDRTPENKDRTQNATYGTRTNTTTPYKSEN